MNAPVCSLCGGRIDADELGPFYWVPQGPDDEPGFQDVEPVQPGEACCDGAVPCGTPYAQALAAALDSDF